MKKKEIVTLALTTALLMTAHAVPASAASNAPESMSQTGSIQTITPRWESTNVVVPSISISGKQISVSVYISPKKSTTSSVGTLYLEKKVGNGWTPVTSWSIDGTGSVSITKTYTGTMGITYRTIDDYILWINEFRCAEVRTIHPVTFLLVFSTGITPLKSYLSSINHILLSS